jgi:ABC-type antimicrobial peptide transport system permease subunit
MGVNAEQGFFLLQSVIKAKGQNRMFQYIGTIASMESVAVTEHRYKLFQNACLWNSFVPVHNVGLISAPCRVAYIHRHGLTRCFIGRPLKPLKRLRISRHTAAFGRALAVLTFLPAPLNAVLYLASFFLAFLSSLFSFKVFFGAFLFSFLCIICSAIILPLCLLYRNM